MPLLSILRDVMVDTFAAEDEFGRTWIFEEGEFKRVTVALTIYLNRDSVEIIGKR